MRNLFHSRFRRENAVLKMRLSGQFWQKKARKCTLKKRGSYRFQGDLYFFWGDRSAVERRGRRPLRIYTPIVRGGGKLFPSQGCGSRAPRSFPGARPLLGAPAWLAEPGLRGMRCRAFSLYELNIHANNEGRGEIISPRRGTGAEPPLVSQSPVRYPEPVRFPEPRRGAHGIPAPLDRGRACW